MYDKIESKHYVTKIKSPSYISDSKRKEQIENSLHNTFVGTRAEFNKKVQKLLSQEIEVYKVEKSKQSRDQSRLNEEFKNDLYKEFGVEENPKREKCFLLAYEQGHSSGRGEVYNYFAEFVELIK